MSASTSLCGQWSAGRVDLDTGEVRAGAIWCKSWTCDHCAPIRQKQLMAQAAQGQPTRFITLTSRRRVGDLTPDQAARQLVHAWRMVIQRGKRDGLIREMQYIAVFEQHRSGWPHLHILARCDFLPQEWLSKRMAEYADSPVVDIRLVKSRARAAWYIAKYTAKAPHKWEGCKRYWRTLSYAPAKNGRKTCVADRVQPLFRQQHVTIFAGFFTAHGYRLEWDSDHSFIALPDTPESQALHRKCYAPRPPPNEYRLCTT